MQDIPIDENTFIVEVAADTAILELTQGSLCVFRSGATPLRDGDIILVQNRSLPDQPSYSIQRYQGEEDYKKNTPIDWDALAASLSTGKQFQDSGCDDYIMGQFICVLE